MPTEPIVVAISEDGGSRVVQRSFEDVGKSAMKAGKQVGQLQSELDQYAATTKNLQAEVAALTKKYGQLETESKQYQTQTKQLQGEVDQLTKRLNYQGKAAHSAAEGTHEAESGIFDLKREMSRENRTVNFFAASLDSVVPASSAAGESLRLLGGVLIGGMGFSVAIDAALAGLKLFGDYIKETTEKQVRQIEFSVAQAYAFREVEAAAKEMAESLDVKDKGSSWLLSELRAISDETRKAQQEMTALIQKRRLMNDKSMGANPFSAMYAMSQLKGLDTEMTALSAKFDELTIKQTSTAANYADTVLPAVLETEERDLAKSIKNTVAAIDSETMKSKALGWVQQQATTIDDQLEGMRERVKGLKDKLAKTSPFNLEGETLEVNISSMEKQISALEDRQKRLKDMAQPIAIAQGNQTAHNWELQEAENVRRVRREIAQVGADEYYAINLRAAGAIEELTAKTNKTLEEMVGASEEAKNRVRKASARESYQVEQKRLAEQAALARKGGITADLTNELEPAVAAVRKVIDAQNQLNRAVAYGFITDNERVRLLGLVDQKYRDQLYPLGAINRELDQETGLLRLSNTQRDVQSKLLANEKNLRQQGVTLSAQERTDLQQKIALNIAMNRIAAERESLEKELTGNQEKLALGNIALNQLLANGTITLQQYNQKLNELKLAAGQGDFSAGFIQQLNVMQASAQRFTSNVGTLFGDMTNGMVDGFAQASAQALVFNEDFETAFNQVGKQALATLLAGLIKIGLQMILNYTVGQALSSAAVATTAAQASAVATAWAPAASLASLATYGSNAAAAMTAITTTTALAESLAMAPGFSAGGYTGDLSRTSTAGVVHGQEFVVNADATARNRGLLEAINSGAEVRGSGTTLKVTVLNQSSAAIQVDRVSRDEVRIIAREEATQTVHREAPRAVANDIANPNGRVSRQLSDSTNVQRRRT